MKPRLSFTAGCPTSQLVDFTIGVTGGTVGGTVGTLAAQPHSWYTSTGGTAHAHMVDYTIGIEQVAQLVQLVVQLVELVP